MCVESVDLACFCLLQPTASSARMIAARQAKRAALAGDKNGEQVNDYLGDPPLLKYNLAIK